VWNSFLKNSNPSRSRGFVFCCEYCPKATAGLGNAAAVAPRWPRSFACRVRARPHELSTVETSMSLFLVPPCRLRKQWKYTQINSTWHSRFAQQRKNQSKRSCVNIVPDIKLNSSSLSISLSSCEIFFIARGLFGKAFQLLALVSSGYLLAVSAKVFTSKSWCSKHSSLTPS